MPRSPLILILGVTVGLAVGLARPGPASAEPDETPSIRSRRKSVEVVDSIWGFDGRVVRGRFAPLSLLVHNPTEAAFDGRIEVFKSNGIGSVIGPIYSEPLKLSPGARRWVQVHVLESNSFSDWLYRLPPVERRARELAKLRFGAPTRVFVVPSLDETYEVRGCSRFLDLLLPKTVAAWSSLGSLVMDARPNLGPEQERALLDWIASGGTLHLLRRADGRDWSLKGPLAALQRPEPELTKDGVTIRTIGLGHVLSHPTTRFNTDVKTFDRGPIPDRTRLTRPLDPHDFFLQYLRREQPKPAHSWALIFTLCGVFMVLVSPVNFVIGRRVADYRVALLFVFVTVAIFSVLFFQIGRRGFREAAAARTIAHVVTLPGDRVLVSQWTDMFFTDSETLELKHDSERNIYACCEDTERVPGVITGAGRGAFQLRVPLYSKRALHHAAVFELEGPDVVVTRYRPPTSTYSLPSFRLAVRGRLPKDLRLAMISDGDRLYRLTVEGDELVSADPQQTHATADLRALIAGRDWWQFAERWWGSENSPTYSQLLGTSLDGVAYLTYPLILHGLEAYSGLSAPTRADGRERYHLLLIAPRPDSLKLQSWPTRADAWMVIQQPLLLDPRRPIGE